MPPQPPTGGASLPHSFTCRVCGKDKAPASYSKTQLQKWFNKKRNDRYNAVTPHNVGLTCKDHASDQREIRCHGPCDRLKVVDHFSKNQRNEPEPWCIDCTEWRLDFNGNELPTAPPNGSLAHHEYDGINDNDDAEFWQRSPHLSGDGDDSADEDESSDDDDENRNPYDDPTIITDVVDRLQGYGLAATDEGITAGAASTTDSVGISGWDEDINATTSDSGSGISARTMTSMQPNTMRSRGTLSNMPTIPDSRGSAFRLQGFPHVAHGTVTPTGVAPHLNRLASQPAMNGGPSTLSGRFSAGRPHSGEEETKRRAVALANEPPRGWKPNVKNQESRKENSNKWYKGDNRRVFPGKKKALGDRVQDGTEAAHDSDSPDVM
ncbi:hypothetical protein F4824DRAFT_420900 [Ustulina deusta]|nr:hypothetical protein F4824DRAFT_420900 [Ustulina deusta]